jgi:hypothetical protein
MNICCCKEGTLAAKTDGARQRSIDAPLHRALRSISLTPRFSAVLASSASEKLFKQFLLRDRHTGLKAGDNERASSPADEFSQIPLLNRGGGGGIRTHEGLRPAGFQDRSHQPLDHPSWHRNCATTNFFGKARSASDGGVRKLRQRCQR